MRDHLEFNNKEAYAGMELTTSVGRRYRRYKHDNQYDSPLLILCIDTALSLFKITLVLAALAAAWTLVTKHKSTEPGEMTTMSEDTPQVTSQGVAASTHTTTSSQPVVTAPTGNTTNRQSPAKMVDGEWIAALNPESFIIQFGSAVEVELFDEFIPFIDNGEPIAIYPFKETPSGKPVFGLATGVYENPDAALAAIDSFSAEARAYQPWVRSVADIQSQINIMLINL